MTYNRVVGKIRLRQLRIAPDAACELSDSIKQSDTTYEGLARHRQFVDHCYGPYDEAHRSEASYGPLGPLQTPKTGGFGCAYTH